LTKSIDAHQRARGKAAAWTSVATLRSRTMERHQPESSNLVQVWDPIVRIGHWVIVAAFAVAYITEGEPEWLHTYAGYAIAATVLIRVIWGFAGPRHARFADFVRGPGAVFGYLRDLVTGKSKRHLGHSPAGGAMTLALLAMLAFTAFTGMANLAAEEGEGPLAGIIARAPSEATAGAPAVGTEEAEEGEEYEGGEGGEREEGFWTELHEVGANLTLLLIILHVGGVIAASIVHRENLPRSMVTGTKRA
jgi:cytochrome b